MSGGRLAGARISSGDPRRSNDNFIAICRTLAAEPLPWNALRSHAIADGLHPGAGGSLWNQPAVNVVYPLSPGCPSTVRQARAQGAVHTRVAPPDHRGASSAGCRKSGPRRAGQRTRRTLPNWFAISENALSRFSLVELLRKIYVPSGRSDWLEQAVSEVRKPTRWCGAATRWRRGAAMWLAISTRSPGEPSRHVRSAAVRYFRPGASTSSLIIVLRRSGLRARNGTLAYGN